MDAGRSETMTPKTARPTSITEYINDAPKEARKKLREMRAFSHHRILVTFAAFEHHIGFYPTPSAVKAFAKELSKFVTASSSIQFPLEKPLPLALIRRITEFRVQECTQEDAKWRTGRKSMSASFS
jgi:uncharacterized protein YdhG (YjbR/CyaY superfamily)